jgi:hypothetical protein
MEISFRSIDSSLTNVLQLANTYLNCVSPEFSVEVTVEPRGWTWKKAGAGYSQLKSAANY